MNIEFSAKEDAGWRYWVDTGGEGVLGPAGMQRICSLGAKEQFVLVLDGIRLGQPEEMHVFGSDTDPEQALTINSILAMEDVDLRTPSVTVHRMGSRDQLLSALKQVVQDRSNVIVVSQSPADRENDLYRSLYAAASSKRMYVDLNAIEHNLATFRKYIPEHTKLMFMAKSNAYNLGAPVITRFLSDKGVHYFGVACVEEAVELRKCGITLPIMVIEPDQYDLDIIAGYDLEPVVHSTDAIRQLLTSPVQDITVQLHLKLNTGMNRLGVNHDEIATAVKLIHSDPRFRIKSLFSNPAAADNPEQDELTNTQFSRFDQGMTEVQSLTGYPVSAHILNTSATLRFPEKAMNMVRIGIGICGMASGTHELQQAVSVSTYVSLVRKVKKGETVGYGGTVRVDADCEIAVIPVGYEDGFPRMLSHGVGEVVVKGKKAPVVGWVCMDMCMIDVTGLEVKKGDEVFVVNDVITIMDLAERLGTIPNEVLTNFSRRVKKIYKYSY
ncbi:MAG: alanine racemase [Flavobacteriales bacterium]|nr:alanine racemase [Flavobacteriales bacterium]MCB9447539.1 alanine racemase [Flavobacteriales bacterium]